MSLPDQAPRLPKWPFFLGDGLLLATAWYIAKTQGHSPLSGPPLNAVVICVVVACILGVIPLVADYAWTQDKALDERQRSLEALARTVGTASEQISIAAQGLHETVHAAEKNLRAADQLPAKLQEQLGQLQERAAAKQSDEIDELEREVAQLRASENDKLEAIAAKLAKAAADFGKAEAAIQKQLSQAGAQAEATAKAQLEALSRAQATAVAAIEAAAKQAVEALSAARPTVTAQAPSPGLQEAVEAVVAPVTDQAPEAPEPAPEPPAPPPEPPPAAVTPTPALAPEVVVEHVPSPAPEAEPHEETPAPEPAAAEPEPASAPLPEPVAVAATPEAAPEPLQEAPAPAAPPKTPRKRAPKKPEVETPAQDEFIQSAPEETAVAVEAADMAISSDGATRLLVTAYIGIGNRLFIRGSGPGLNWEKGVPLQFVSIGKWRWETAEATEPVTFRLYKNDDVECTGLGERTLDPGHQTQLAASF